MPDGDVELGLEAWDNSGNHYVYSEHYANYHITKNYNCNPAPTADFDAWPQSGTAPLTVSMHNISSGTYTSLLLGLWRWPHWHLVRRKRLP